MKLKTYIPIYISLLLLCLTGCQQDEWQSASQQSRLTSVTATASSSAQTRTLLSGNSVIWEESDAIGIFSDVSTEALRYDLTSLQDNEARFENETGVNGETFYAFYPYSAQSVTDGTAVSYHLTAEQDYRPGSFDTGNCPMVARSTTNEFRFLQTCGIIRLRLTGTMAVSTLYLQGNSNEAIAGDGVIDIVSDAPTFRIQDNSESQNVIQLRLADKVQLSETGITEFHFVVPPQTFAQGITIRITGTIDGQEREIQKQTTKSVIVSRSLISSFTAIDTNAELEPEGPTDREVLIALYDATNGDNWTNNTNWCTDEPLSEWYGVTCRKVNGEDKVLFLELAENNLVGTLPEEIGYLNILNYLLLNDNQLAGGIPASIGNLVNLEQLYLASNNLTGNIPPELGNLSNLRRCDLYTNDLTGSIPPELGNLTNLKSLYLHINQLTGNIPPELGNLTNLEDLCLFRNQLTGNIPSELGNLTNLKKLQLYNNQLTENIPSELGNLTNLEDLYLFSNQLTGNIPPELGNLTNLKNLDLNSNQLAGNIPPELGNLSNLTNCALDNNQLTGEIPESLARLTKLELMHFYGNMLSGNLPEAVTSTKWWQKLGYWNIRQNNPGGFTFATLNLYIPDFTFTDYQGNSVHTTDVVAQNKVTLYYMWTTWSSYCTRYHPTVSQVYQRYKNHGLGIIGICGDYETDPNKAYEIIENNGMEWPTASGYPEGGIPIYTYPTILAFDENGKMIFHSDYMERDNLPDFLEDILGPGEAAYESTDFSADKEAYTLQTASTGNGINVVLMGDAFSDRQIADGTYEDLMHQGMEAFFSEEPYKSFRNMFNVYYVNAVSKTEGYVDGGETVFSCYFGEGTHVGGNDELCMQYAQEALDFTDEEMNEMLIIVMMNSPKYAGTCWMYYSTAYPVDYGRGYAVAYFPAMAGNEALTTVLHHEAGGHGFAKLGDEYVIEENGHIPTEEIESMNKDRTYVGWWKNVDFTSDPSEVYWSKFISDPRYAGEDIGVYEGACTYQTGVYRPTENSIMRDNTGGFNAPSREAIYYRIHKLAYGEDWQYDFEEFVEWDLSRARTRSTGVTAKKIPHTAPPVITKARWENGRIVKE